MNHPIAYVKKRDGWLLLRQRMKIGKRIVEAEFTPLRSDMPGGIQAFFIMTYFEQGFYKSLLLTGCCGRGQHLIVFDMRERGFE